MTTDLVLRLIGDLRVVKSGVDIDRPASRKTRAILGFLALSERGVSRQRLCDLFFDAPDDPRAALRWSLSKLRPMLDAPDRPRLIADRETVRLNLADADVDALRLIALAARPPAEIADEELIAVLAGMDGEFLDDADLPDRPEYAAWRYAQRQDLRTIEADLVRERLRRLPDVPAARIPHFQRLIALDPLDEAAYSGLGASLMALGRRDEAHAIVGQAERVLGQARLKVSPSLRAALRTAAAPAAPPAPARGPATASGQPQLVVIPFRNHSPDIISDSDMDSLLEGVVHCLSRFRSFRVSSVSSVLRYKDRVSDPAEVREATGAHYMIGGSVIAREGRLTVRYRIVDTLDGALTASGDLDPFPYTTQAMLEDIPNDLVSILAHQIYETARAKAAAVPEADRNAYEHFFCGLSAGSFNPPFDFQRALACYQMAIEKQPDFPAALALSAFSRVQAGGARAEPARSQTLAEARAALATSNDDSQALAIAAWVIVYLEQDFDTALKAVDLAVRINPISRVGWTTSAWIRTMAGEYETPMRDWERADRCNPLGAFADRAYGGRAICSFLAGRDEDARLWAKRCLDRSAHDPTGLTIGVAAAWRMGDREAALALARTLLAAFPKGFRAPPIGGLPLRQPAHRTALYGALEEAISHARERAGSS